jgi:hypothetical protein
MWTWEFVLALIAGTFAIVATVISAIVLIEQRTSLKNEIGTIRKTDTKAAIESADLDTLGRHLVERLGAASVSNFSRSDELQLDFQDAFGAVRAYLNQPGYRSVPAAEVDQPAEVPTVDAIEQDDEWNTLARARRDLERVLRDRAGTVGTKMLSLPQLIEAAKRTELIDDDEGSAVAHALRVAARSIHGEDVSPSEAANAAAAMTGLALRLRHPQQEDPDGTATKKATSRNRIVRPTDGGWAVEEPTSKRVVARTKSQKEAVDRARDIVYKAGGGEVYIYGRDGVIRGRDTVASRRHGDPRV